MKNLKSTKGSAMAFEKFSNNSLKTVDLEKLRGAKGTCHDEDDEKYREAGWLDQF